MFATQKARAVCEHLMDLTNNPDMFLDIISQILIKTAKNLSICSGFLILIADKLQTDLIQLK